MKEDKYKQDGVDVEEGDKFSDFAAKLCRTTYENSQHITIRDFSQGHFRGPRGFQLRNLPLDCWMDMAPDGKGTKPVLVDAAGNYEHAARGLVAMVAGDITRWGGLPLVLVNNLDTGSIGKEGDRVNRAFRTMLVSLKNIADEQGFVMFKGETAELGYCIYFENKNALTRFLWSAVMLGVYLPRTIITGDEIQVGMIFMALRDPGFGNNGLSTTRAALAMHFGSDFYSLPEAQEAIKLAAAPTTLYDKFLATANGWFNYRFEPLIPVKLIVHVTGGAIESKLAKDILFPRGLSANLNDLWEPSPIMKDCAKWRGLTDRECYRYWHGGQRVLVVIEERDVLDFLDLASSHGIDAKVAGEITKEMSPKVTIASKFNGDIIEFTPNE